MRNKMLGPKEFIEDAIQKIKDQIGDEKAIIALSGGVDSSADAEYGTARITRNHGRTGIS